MAQKLILLDYENTGAGDRATLICSYHLTLPLPMPLALQVLLMVLVLLVLRMMLLVLLLHVHLLQRANRSDVVRNRMMLSVMIDDPRFHCTIRKRHRTFA